MFNILHTIIRTKVQIQQYSSVEIIIFLKGSSAAVVLL
jgi:hypothetical protein